MNPLNLIYPDIARRVKIVYADMWTSYRVRMYCCQGGRSWKYQEGLYNQGRTTPGQIVTFARGGESSHNFYLAQDSCFGGPDPFLEHNDSFHLMYLWDEYGSFLKQHGMTWGGDFPKPDRPHGQDTYGLSLKELQAIYRRGKLEAVWTEIDRIRGVVCDWESLRSTIRRL